LVVKTEPPGGTSTPDPMIVVGDERLGTTVDYAGLAGLSQRVHRVEYLMDPRGGGHSVPSLDCPEVTSASGALVGLRFRDANHVAALRAAVQACHDRLVTLGIDVSAYDFAASAADFHDLRVALGITAWDEQAFGPASELAFVEARLFPDGLRSIVVDSPTLPEPNSIASGPAGLDLAIARLSTDCAATPICATRAPDLAGMIKTAVAKLDATPMTFDVDGTARAILAGHSTRVVIDGSALLRFIRSKLGMTHPDGAAVVSVVWRVLNGSLDPKDAAVVNLSTDVGDCLGMIPLCDRVNFGTLYSFGCGDALSDASRTALERDIAGRGPYADLFSPGPLGAACGAWGSHQPAPLRPRSLTGGVPILMLRGRFDPFSATPEQIGVAAGTATDTFVLEIPNAGYNVLSSYECVVAIRNAWVDAPTSPPSDTSCLATIPPITLGN
jgi:hypothetical protein